jgi:C4-type Zn-finger protein
MMQGDVISLSEEDRDEMQGAVARYYYACPRCDSTATALIGLSELITTLKKFIIYKWVCQECCHVFEIMKRDDVRELTGWVD